MLNCTHIPKRVVVYMSPVEAGSRFLIDEGGGVLGCLIYSDPQNKLVAAPYQVVLKIDS